MTACNIITQGNVGYLLTDTAWFWDDGVIGMLAPKFSAMSGFPSAVAARGAFVDIGALAAAMSAPDIDSLLRKGPQVFRAHLAQMQATFPAMQGPDDWKSVLYVVAWCSRMKRVRGFAISSAADDMPDGYVPYTWLTVQEGLSPGLDLAELYGAEPDTSHPMAFSVPDEGLRILEAQRANPWPVNGSKPYHRVGGQACLAEVREAGVSVRVLKCWGDQVGARVAV